MKPLWSLLSEWGLGRRFLLGLASVAAEVAEDVALDFEFEFEFEEEEEEATMSW